MVYSERWQPNGIKPVTPKILFTRLPAADIIRADLHDIAVTCSILA